MTSVEQNEQGERDELTGAEIRAHGWDGIREFNNPLPRWWLITFYVSIFWSVGYWVLMPAWPTLDGYTKGLRNHSERANVVRAIEALDESRAAPLQRLLTVETVAEVENDPELLQYTFAAGRSLFGDNCATCHGAGGQGFPGFPNLNDDSWLWGGSFDDIQRTIRFGVRNEHPSARQSVMQAFGRDGILAPDAINDLVDLVRVKSGQDGDAAAAARAEPIFAQNCASCHGADARGNSAFGAPNLTDAIWNYGGDRTSIHESIFNGRAGVMPGWEGRLAEEQIVALAAYVHALGGGQ